jgi:DNA (cytosine-5)-methyltransferase 1
MRVAGLFAGIGGFEHGLAADGRHEAVLLCDVLPQSKAVLNARFDGVDYAADVTRLTSLPSDVDCVTAGFPCQDLSQAGRTAGLDGARSGLISEVFRLLRDRPVSTVVVENVSFMLQLGGGSAMRAIVDEFEALGYRWAYRLVDTFSFGLPQRRERVYLVASKLLDPAQVLLADDNLLPRPANGFGRIAHGFYWTEGKSGLGWAVDSVPTLKNGSTVGIASPPAVLMPDGQLVKPSIEDGEALQGFPRGWTEPAEAVAKRGYRWGLVGSAVSVPVARWLGRRLAMPGDFDSTLDRPFPDKGKCPRAARFDGVRRTAVEISADPVGMRPPPLAEFLHAPLDPLSLRASQGFLNRTSESTSLLFKDEFLDRVEAYVLGMGGTVPPRRTRLAKAA